MEAADTICNTCWAGINMIGPSVCRGCGLPFDFDQDAALCGECIRLTPPFARARSAIVYDEASRGLILAFKHGDRPEAARLFAQWMITCAPEFITDAEVVVPVPLDRKRLFMRRYNQAALIARFIANAGDIPIIVDAVERIRPTPRQGQGHMTPSQRRRNVSGAFIVPASRKEDIQGRRVLLIDDVYTTGATARAVSRQLNRAGAKAVDVLTTARAVKES